MNVHPTRIEVFYSYAHKDEALHDEPEKHPSIGNGSIEDVGPFQIVTTEKEAQAYVVHNSRFGKRESLSYETKKHVAAVYYSNALHILFHLFFAYTCREIFIVLFEAMSSMLDSPGSIAQSLVPVS